jgi:hypothetical protein
VHGFADQEALREVAMTASQKLQLCNRFDTFRGDLYVESAGHGNGGTNDTLMTVVYLHVLNQRGIEYKAVDYASIQRAE